MLAVFRVDDQLAFVQEFVGDHDGLVEIAARVAPQVEDEFGGALRTQRIQRCLHLVEGRPCELSQLDVTDAVGNAERRFYAFDRNLVANDVDAHQVGDTLASQPEVYGRAARAAQFLHHVALREFLPRDERVIDLDNAVARLDAGLVARALRDDVQHDHRVGRHVEDHADAVEFAFERFVDFLHLRCRNIDRVGIELLDQQRDDVLGKRIHGYRIDILVLDERKRIGEFVGGQRHLAEHPFDLRSGAVAAHVLPQQQPQHNTRCQQQREEDGVFRVLIHLRVIRRPAAGLFLRFFLVLERIRQTDAQQRTGLHVEVLRPVVVELET